MPINYSKYPPNWKTEVVPSILERANNCCEECGLENYSIVYSVMIYGEKRKEWVKEEKDARRLARRSGWKVPTDPPIVRPVKVILTIAHLDHDEENWEGKDDRLKALCQLHHLQYDAKEKYRTQTKKK